MHQLKLIREDEVQARHYDLSCSSEQTIYSAAEQQGFRLPASCLNGVCHICRASLISGKVLSGNAQQLLARDPAQAPPQVMLCKTWPLETCSVLLKNIYGPGELPVKNVKCQVLNVERLKGHVFQVDLQLPAGKQPEFFPGQYLALSLPDKTEASYFSIASAPGQRIINLHIQADPHLLSALEVIGFLQMSMDTQRAVSVSLPYGEACLSAMPTQPIILIAAGTGFAQMKSILEYLFEHDFSYPVALYWGVRKAEDMYLHELAESWAAKHVNFTFRPIIGELEDGESTDHHEQLSAAVLAEQPVDNARVFVSGSPKLVFSVMDALLAAGLPEQQFFSDVLAYATRT